MSEYTVVNAGQTFFVPKFGVDAFLPEFVEGLESYLAAQSLIKPQHQHSAYRVLSTQGIDNADQWLAALLIAPLATADDGYKTTELGIAGFTKYYAKAWNLFDPKRPRDGYEAVLRIIRTFFTTTKLVEDYTVRSRGNVEQQVNFRLTELGKRLYPELKIEVADEDNSAAREPSTQPIEYMSAPWLASVDRRHAEMQHPDVEQRLADQATAASSVGFVIPENIVEVYIDWFPLATLPPKAETKLERFLQRKDRHKFISVRLMQEQRKEVLSKVAGELCYYPVGFDRKARQYMLGYPINPQGAKVDRPLFYVLADNVDKDKAIADLTMEGKDAFGDQWGVATKLTLEQLNNHNDPYVMEVCSTKGTQDLHKYTILLELAKYDN